jgi:hypothetical protein
VIADCRFEDPVGVPCAGSILALVLLFLSSELQIEISRLEAR